MKIFVVVDGDNCKTPAETFCPGDRKGLMRSIGDEPYTPTGRHQEGSYTIAEHLFWTASQPFCGWMLEWVGFGWHIFWVETGPWIFNAKPWKNVIIVLVLDEDWGWLGENFKACEIYSCLNLYQQQGSWEIDQSVNHIYWGTNVWKLLKVRQQFPMGPVLNSKI